MNPYGTIEEMEDSIVKIVLSGLSHKNWVKFSKTILNPLIHLIEINIVETENGTYAAEFKAVPRNPEEQKKLAEANIDAVKALRNELSPKLEAPKPAEKLPGPTEDEEIPVVDYEKEDDDGIKAEDGTLLIYEITQRIL